MTDSNFGRKLKNRYGIMDTIGQGSMGKVYLAEDLLLGGVPVAIKFLSQALLTEKMRERFFREAMTCAQLGQKSIHVVRVQDYDVTEDGIPFYVMEYLKGQNLAQIIQAQPLPIPRFLGLTQQICIGLQVAHEGIVLKNQVVPIIHRDIKPSNILVTLDSTVGELVKILDFGIAKLMQADSDQTSSFMGTLAYASPEQMDGHNDLDNRTDIYSLGVMMYQMLTCALPVRPNSNTFGGWYKAHHTQTVPRMGEVDSTINVPKLLEDVVMSCLAKNRDDRPKTVGDLLNQLAPLNNRFNSGFKISQRINTTLTKLPVVKKAKQTDVGDTEEDRFCKLQTWPKNKPIAEIVFPQILSMSNHDLATLWSMLPLAEIERRQKSTRYSNFICTLSPHPMALWLTALYSQADGAAGCPAILI
jgi:serine/threonine protein kinase